MLHSLELLTESLIKLVFDLNVGECLVWLFSDEFKEGLVHLDNPSFIHMWQQYLQAFL